MTNHILVVEDDERIRSSMRLALEGEGYSVDEAGSGEEGLDLFSADPADIALVDLMLPGMDGSPGDTGHVRQPSSRSTSFRSATARRSRTNPG